MSHYRQPSRRPQLLVQRTGCMDGSLPCLSGWSRLADLTQEITSSLLGRRLAKHMAQAGRRVFGAARPTDGAATRQDRA